MGFFDYYSDDAPRAKTMRVNVINTFLLHVAQCITFHHRKTFIETLISEASLKSFYSRLCFKVIKDFSTSPHFEVAHKQFYYESGGKRSIAEK